MDFRLVITLTPDEDGYVWWHFEDRDLFDDEVLSVRGGIAHSHADLLLRVLACISGARTLWGGREPSDAA